MSTSPDDATLAQEVPLYAHQLRESGRNWIRIGARTDEQVGWTLSGFLPLTELAAKSKGLYILYVPVRMGSGPTIGIYLSQEPEVSKQELSDAPDGVKPL